ncbi:MAG: sorbosone dehydrogenase [Candidatus Rokuibacteriota bacterium]|nr:MAG: sorbosone dehydrogenase [Candidatus Rokubacteria bacterium]
MHGLRMNNERAAMNHPSPWRVIAAIVFATTILVLASTSAQTQTAPQPSVATKYDPVADQELGRRISVSAETLPPPKTPPLVRNTSLIVPYAGQTPKAMPGFTVAPYVTGLEHPRRLLVLPNGDVIVAEQRVGYLTLLRDSNGDGKVDYISRYADDFRAPYGLAYRDGWVLVADQDGIWRVPHVMGALRAGRPFQQKVTDVPPDQRKPTPNVYLQELITKKGVFGVVAGHQNRPLAIDPKSGALFVGVGSVGNIAVEPEVKASIQRFDADGSNQSTFASGMRNPTAIAFQPGTGDLYTVVQERDGLGDRVPPDFLTRVARGAFYGWPFSYTGQNPQGGFASLAPEKVKAAVKPDLLFEAHSSVLDILFYEGSQFPDEYRGDAFVALKGSWNRSEPTGYKVVRVRFKDGRPEGWYQNFLTGFWISGTDRAEVWGRPTALAVTRDGSLLVADDTGGTIWRVSSTGPRTQGAGAPQR